MCLCIPLSLQHPPLQPQIAMDPSSYSEKRTRPTFQLADSISTRDDSHDKVIAGCNGV